MDDTPITDRVCQARMKTTDESLQTIKENTEDIKESLKQLPSLCEQVKTNTKDIDDIKSWRRGLFKGFFWFIGSILTITITALTIYEKLKK
jgi:uncharacterized protein YecA (UPF0149 family)